ncbi:hypothetical protein J2S55_008256 [Streptosporangium brasiliense]|uniref:Uncharacterized protein n=1 Tax=Streptosporangium brasiliense TaxID=47480 RepID=A0ABT9RKY2_9ACTN|nr:hypothetical protein [Streptosporangium brasiliense]
MSVELGGGESDRVGDLGGVGEGLPGERGPAQQSPPALGQVQPAGPDRDEHLADPRMTGRPSADPPAEMAGQIVGDDHDRATPVGGGDLLKQLDPAVAVARGRAEGEFGAVADAQRAVDPGLVGAA